MPVYSNLSEEEKKKQLQENDAAVYSQPEKKAQAEPAANTNGNSADTPEQNNTANTPGYAYDPSTNVIMWPSIKGYQSMGTKIGILIISFSFL